MERGISLQQVREGRSEGLAGERGTRATWTVERISETRLIDSKGAVDFGPKETARSLADRCQNSCNVDEQSADALPVLIGR